MNPCYQPTLDKIPLSASIGAFLMAILIGGTHGSDLD